MTEASSRTGNAPETPAAGPPPALAMLQMATAFWLSRSLYAAAELGLADHLAEGPKRAEELAPLVGAHAPSLRRLMSFLCSVGVLEQGADRRFALTPIGALLRSDVKGSMRSFVRVLGLGVSWDSWGEIVHSVKTGRPAVEKVRGVPLFDYLASQPEEGALFNDFVASLYGDEPPAIARAYDFSGMNRVVDIGGGKGSLLGTILLENPRLSGVVFDMPHVAPAAREHLAGLGLADRCAVESGSFFEAVPRGGDAYILSHIIHDWDDDSSVAIFKRCREAMSPSSRLLLVESVLAEGNGPDPGKLMDVAMLIVTGGVERSAADFAALLERAGFMLRRIVPTPTASSIIEAVPT